MKRLLQSVLKYRTAGIPGRSSTSFSDLNADRCGIWTPRFQTIEIRSFSGENLNNIPVLFGRFRATLLKPMGSESLSALISAAVKVQRAARTALGLDTEKRPFPCRTHEIKSQDVKSKNHQLFSCALRV